MVVLGASLGRFRGAHGDRRQGRRVGREFRLSDFATFLRTLVVVAVLAGILTLTGKWGRLSDVPPRAGLFLVLSGLATGASWLCYFRALKLGDAARVAPVDKLSVVLVAIFGVIFLGESLGPLAWFGIGLIGSGVVLIAFAA